MAEDTEPPLQNDKDTKITLQKEEDTKLPLQIEEEEEEEALRLKTIAEIKYKESNFKSALKQAKKAKKLSPKLQGISSMVTAFKILYIASKKNNSGDFKDWYQILSVEPFSHINVIKKQYKKLALNLHPDKNHFLGCEDAFKFVSEGFSVLSDKIRRKEYDLRLRIKLQEENVGDGVYHVETFWTACGKCRLLHQFERKYLGHMLMCPSCKVRFEAVEVGDEGKEGVGVRVSERLKRKGAGQNDRVEESESIGLRSKACSSAGKDGNLAVEVGGLGEWGGGRLRTGGLRRKMSTVGDILERSEPTQKVKVEEETMTLAEMRLEAKKKAMQGKEKLKEKQKETTKTSEKEKEKLDVLEKVRDINSNEIEASESDEDCELVDLEVRRSVRKCRNLAGDGHSILSLTDHRTSLKNGDLEMTDTEDSDLYDFERERGEKNFKKGQVWAIYDDEEMPRRYGVIDEVHSFKPFRLKLSWLDRQSNADKGLISWEKMGFRISCGRYKVSRKTNVNSMNIFSHVVDCERAAKEVYMIYPKKGSVWALYNEVDLGAEGRNVLASDKKSYEIALCLTSYSEMYGLSMAYLEKADGSSSLFKRREIGAHAIKLLGKDNVQLLSHQIPAKKLSGNELPAHLTDCWELDPALVSSSMISIV